MSVRSTGGRGGLSRQVGPEESAATAQDNQGQQSDEQTFAQEGGLALWYGM